MKNQNEFNSMDGSFLSIEQEVAERAAREKKKSMHRAIFIGVPILVLVIVYVVVTMYYNKHFFKNVRINGVNVGHKTITEAVSLLEENNKEYTLELVGRDPADPNTITTVGTISGGDISLNKKDYDTIVSFYFDKQFAPLWFLGLIGKKDYTVMSGITLDERGLGRVLAGMEVFSSANVVFPDNAHVSEYDEATNSYSMLPKKKGSMVDITKLRSVIADAVTKEETSINLDELGCYIEPEADENDPDLGNLLKLLNIMVSSELVYDWNGNQLVIDGSVIHDWILIDGKHATLNANSINQYISEKAEVFDQEGVFTANQPALSEEIIAAIYVGENTGEIKKVPSR